MDGLIDLIRGYPNKKHQAHGGMDDTRRKVSNDGKKISAYIETDLPICLSNFVYFNIFIVKGMWWACIRTNIMIAVAQKTCFNQKITQKIH